MFSVELRLPDGGQNKVTAQINSMQEWLDHSRFEPWIFRYRFESTVLVFQVDFGIEAEAAAFAAAFGGRSMHVTDRRAAAD